MFHAAELFAHCDEAAPKAGLDGSDRQSGLFGDFRMGVSMLEEKVEKLAGVVGQACDGCSDGFRVAIKGRFGWGGGGDGLRGLQRFEARLASLAAEEIDRPPTGDKRDESGLGGDRGTT